MKSRVISHPANEPLVMFRRWQLLACGGNVCAAMLLNHFEYWHDIKLAQSGKAGQANDVAEKHGDARTQDESLWQFHTLEDLESALLGAYKRDKVIQAIKLLEDRGFIVTSYNPNPRYKFDKTKFFLFQADTVQQFVDGIDSACRESKNRLSKSENRLRQSENQSPKSENRLRQSENRQTIPKITCTEITTEITSESVCAEVVQSDEKPKTHARPGTSLQALPASVSEPGAKTEPARTAQASLQANQPFAPNDDTTVEGESLADVIGEVCGVSLGINPQRCPVHATVLDLLPLKVVAADVRAFEHYWFGERGKTIPLTLNILRSDLGAFVRSRRVRSAQTVNGATVQAGRKRGFVC